MNGFRGWSAGLLAGALLLTACGGGGDGGDADDTTTSTTTDAAATTTTTAGDSATTTTTTAESDPGPGAGSGDENMATVTIDGTEYRFDVSLSPVGRCEADFFGAFWVIASAADGSRSSLELFVVPEGNTNHDETSRLSVNLQEAEGRDWRADADGGQGVTAGESSVDSFTIDGNSVSGTASFVDTYGGDRATTQGTFAATCPG